MTFLQIAEKTSVVVRTGFLDMNVRDESIIEKEQIWFTVFFLDGHGEGLLKSVTVLSEECPGREHISSHIFLKRTRYCRRSCQERVNMN